MSSPVRVELKAQLTPVVAKALELLGRQIRERSGAEVRQFEEKDKEYFRGVHEVLGMICGKIETGEYYEALLDVAARKEREGYIF